MSRRPPLQLGNCKLTRSKDYPLSSHNTYHTVRQHYHHHPPQATTTYSMERRNTFLPSKHHRRRRRKKCQLKKTQNIVLSIVCVCGFFVSFHAFTITADHKSTTIMARESDPILVTIQVSAGPKSSPTAIEILNKHDAVNVLALKKEEESLAAETRLVFGTAELDVDSYTRMERWRFPL